MNMSLGFTEHLSTRANRRGDRALDPNYGRAVDPDEGRAAEFRTKIWCARQESNLYREFRKLLFYPLNYGRQRQDYSGSQEHLLTTPRVRLIPL